MEAKVKHLEMIQAIVSRLSSHSFLVKGWSLTLASGIVAAVAAGQVDSRFILFAYFTTAAFWTLDGYFLLAERRFRKLYDDVRVMSEEQVDFSMSLDSDKAEQQTSWVKVSFSLTLALFHGAVFGSIVIMMLILH